MKTFLLKALLAEIFMDLRATFNEALLSHPKRTKPNEGRQVANIS